MVFRIKEARIAKNLTQRELADMLGIKDATLSGYETGTHDPKSNMLIEIARICGTTVNYLLGLDPGDFDGKAQPGGAACTGEDSVATELLNIYSDLNALGQQALIGTARGLSANPDMRKDGGSKSETA